MRFGQTGWVYDFLTPRFMHGKDNDLQLFSNLTRGNSAPLCLMAQAVLSSRGQRAFSIEERHGYGCSAAELSSSLPTN
ncbi:unnamed protein product [Brassica rapa subsp. trilocularis]